MPLRVWLSYGRNLSRIEAAEHLALLQLLHTADPARYARRLRSGLGPSAAGLGRDTDAQVARMARDRRFRDAVVLGGPEKKEK